LKTFDQISVHFQISDVFFESSQVFPKEFERKRNQKKSFESGKNYVDLLLKKQIDILFSIFAVPHIAVITDADCMPFTIIAFGALMAFVSVAWVRFWIEFFKFFALQSEVIQKAYYVRFILIQQ